MYYINIKVYSSEHILLILNQLIFHRPVILEYIHPLIDSCLLALPRWSMSAVPDPAEVASPHGFVPYAWYWWHREFDEVAPRTKVTKNALLRYGHNTRSSNDHPPSLPRINRKWQSDAYRVSPNFTSKPKKPKLKLKNVPVGNNLT